MVMKTIHKSKESIRYVCDDCQILFITTLIKGMVKTVYRCNDEELNNGGCNGKNQRKNNA